MGSWVPQILAQSRHSERGKRRFLAPPSATTGSLMCSSHGHCTMVGQDLWFWLWKENIYVYYTTMPSSVHHLWDQTGSTTWSFCFGKAISLGQKSAMFTGINGDQRGAAQAQRELLVPELCGGDTERFSMPVIPIMEDHEMPFIWGPKKSKQTRDIWWYVISGWWFGTWLLLSPMVGMIQSDELIFFRGVGIPPTSKLVRANHHFWIGKPSITGPFSMANC